MLTAKIFCSEDMSITDYYTLTGKIVIQQKFCQCKQVNNINNKQYRAEHETNPSILP